MFLLNLTVFDYFVLFVLFACVSFLYYQQIKLRKLLPYTSTSVSTKTKVLSVVAGENLDTSSIEKALYTTDIQYNLLPYSEVSQDSLLAELDKDVTVFELSSHGLNGSFRLGNATIPATWLATVLGQHKRLECVLLLYCNSYQDLEMIAANQAFTVGLVGDVADTSCITFARHFYFFLNKHFEYKEAFERARLHLPIEDFPKFIFKDGRTKQWQYSSNYLKIIDDLLSHTFIVSTIGKLIKTLIR